MKSIFSKIYKKNIDHCDLLIIFLIAFVLRCFLKKFQFAVSFDEVNYLKLAASGAVDGFLNVLHPFWSPLYPFIVALLSEIISNVEFAGRFISILCGSLLIFPVYYLARYNISRKVAVISTLLLALNPIFSYLSTYAATESLYTFLSVSGILFAWSALKGRSVLKGCIAGIVFALAYLTRPEGVGFVIIYCLIIAFLSLRNFILKGKEKYLRTVVFFLLGFIITVVPYLVYLHNETGEWTISAKGKALQQAGAVVFIGKNEEGFNYRLLSEDNERLLIDKMFHEGDFLQSERNRGKPVINVTLPLLVKKYLSNLYKISKIIVPDVIPLILFIFLILGLFTDVWSKERMGFEFFLLSFICFFWFIIVPLFHISERYFIPLLPVCYIWIGRGLVYFYFWLKEGISKIFIRSSSYSKAESIAVIVIILFLLFAYIPGFVKIFLKNPYSTDLWADPVELKEAGLWLRENKKRVKPPVIMSFNHTAGFYAGNYQITESVSVPENKLDRVLAYARYRKVDYIVLTERYSKEHPEISFLVNGEENLEEMKLIYKNKHPSGFTVVIYELKRN